LPNFMLSANGIIADIKKEKQQKEEAKNRKQ
jgi:hypothetical protein